VIRHLYYAFAAAGRSLSVGLEDSEESENFSRPPFSERFKTMTKQTPPKKKKTKKNVR